MKSLVEALEPVAVASLTNVRNDTFSPEQAMAVAALSTAISMKRLADKLEAIMPGDALPAYFAEQAAYIAGAAFERGRGR